MISKINKLRIINKLKSVYRYNSVNNRKESSAEHSWSCLILADFFLTKLKYESKRNINRLKVYELLMYHDIVEIEAGDTPLHPENKDNTKKEREALAKTKLIKELPEPINLKFKKLFKEFEEQKTIESKFARAIDSLDAIIHEMDYKKDWIGWTKEFIIKSKIKHFSEFPELKEIFFELLKEIDKKGYFKQHST